MIEPGFWYYGLVVLATAATIIASQALITGAFSITHQAIRLGFFPRIEVIHTSADLEGRVYLPFMNLVLAVSCICLVLVFKRSSELAAAYGLAVSGTMFFTTLLFFAVVVYRWRIAFWKIFPLFLLLISIDLAFLVSNFSKIMDGGYLPIVIGAVFFLIMLVWKNGRLSLSKFYRERSKNLEEFIQDIESGSVRRVPGTLVALSSNENKVPPVLIRLVETTHAIHENILLLTVITPDEPQVQASERVKIYPVSDRIFRVIMKFGFMEKVDVPGTLASCQFEGIGKMNADQMIYVLGKETVVVRGKSRMDRLRQEFFSFLSRNASPASDAFNLPPRQVLELGSQMAL
jgi:KUP system potassium uptake protein